MMVKRLWVLALSLLMTAVFVTAAMADIQVMTKDELKEKLDDPNLVVVDVRTGKDWKASELKIKGAVRANAKDPSALAKAHGKDKTLVFYCA